VRPGLPASTATIALALALALALGACGKQGISVPEADPAHAGAVLFAERCSGCHTLAAAGTQGSANRGQRNQGPNFDQRTEKFDDVLFAIRNGGFSGAIMPQNIVTGEDATKVATFLEKYSGKNARTAVRPGSGK
jgi:mono/diheme cytochrome c family protein